MESAALRYTLQTVSSAARFESGGLFALALALALAGAAYIAGLAGVEVFAEVVPVIRAVELDALATADAPGGVEAHEVIHVGVAVVAELLVAVVVGSFHGVCRWCGSFGVLPSLAGHPLRARCLPSATCILLEVAN